LNDAGNVVFIFCYVFDLKKKGYIHHYHYYIHHYHAQLYIFFPSGLPKRLKMKRAANNNDDNNDDKKKSSSKKEKKPSSSNTFVKTCLDTALANIPDKHSMFGSLQDSKLVMPKSHSDKRSLTWEKTILTVSKKIINKPTTDLDCWFVKANHGFVDHITKLSKDGSKNKWCTVRMLYVILHPDALSLVDNREKKKTLYCLHRCGKGKGKILCINPNHIKLDTTKQNRHDERCGHSCRALCPHEFPCVFTWKDTGLQKPCLNKETYNSEACHCVPKCSHVDSVNEGSVKDDEEQQAEESNKEDEDEDDAV